MAWLGLAVIGAVGGTKLANLLARGVPRLLENRIATCASTPQQRASGNNLPRDRGVEATVGAGVRRTAGRWPQSSHPMIGLGSSGGAWQYRSIAEGKLTNVSPLEPKFQLAIFRKTGHGGVEVEWPEAQSAWNHRRTSPSTE